MSAHEWFVTSRVPYVARSLDPVEETAFADHLARCEECRNEVTAIEHDLAWLPMAVKPVSVRPGFRGEIARAILENPARVRRPNAVWLWAAAASVVATSTASIAFVSAARHDSAQFAAAVRARDSSLAGLRDTLSDMRDTLSVMRESSRVLQAQITLGQRTGGLLIFADQLHHRWQVVMHGLPPAPVGEAYQFWFICGDGMIRDATLIGDPDRPAVYTLILPPNSGPVLGASLTLEPVQDSSKGPKGKELAHLLL